MVTHCNIKGAIRCLFTAERMRWETFTILWPNTWICSCTEYPCDSNNAVPSLSIAAADTATRPAASTSSCESCIISGSGKSLENTAFTARGSDYGGGDGFGDYGVVGAGSGDNVVEGHI